MMISWVGWEGEGQGEGCGGAEMQHERAGGGLAYLWRDCVSGFSKLLSVRGQYITTALSQGPNVLVLSAVACGLVEIGWKSRSSARKPS